MYSSHVDLTLNPRITNRATSEPRLPKGLCRPISLHLPNMWIYMASSLSAPKRKDQLRCYWLMSNSRPCQQLCWRLLFRAIQVHAACTLYNAGPIHAIPFYRKKKKKKKKNSHVQQEGEPQYQPTHLIRVSFLNESTRSIWIIPFVSGRRQYTRLKRISAASYIWEKVKIKQNSRLPSRAFWTRAKSRDREEVKSSPTSTCAAAAASW